MCTLPFPGRTFVRNLLILLSVLVCSCQKDFATKYGYRDPQVPSDIPHYKQPVVGARGYDTPDPGETIIDLHKRYLYTHKRAFCEAAEQWERDGRFDYRSFRDVVSMDFTWEGKRGFWDGYQLFKRQICQKEASSGVTSFILAMSVDITTEPPAWDSQDVIFVMEWNRTTSSDPHNVAAYATASRENELKQWQRQQPDDCMSPITLITSKEAVSVWTAIGQLGLVLRVGPPPWHLDGDGLVLKIATGCQEYDMDLGASEETARVLAVVRDALGDEHRDPIDGVIKSLRDLEGAIRSLRDRIQPVR